MNLNLLQLQNPLRKGDVLACHYFQIEFADCNEYQKILFKSIGYKLTEFAPTSNVYCLMSQIALSMVRYASSVNVHPQ